MASSTLRNDQQIKQSPVKKTTDSTGNGNVLNSSFGKGSGKIVNGLPCLDNTAKGKGAK